MTQYVLDTNVFIQAHRAYYPLDVATTFWRKLAQLAAAGHLISLDKVKAEIDRNQDALASWCQDELSGSFFHPSDSALPQYAQVMQWAGQQLAPQRYTQAAFNEFADVDNADARLVAFAMAAPDRVLVTQEVADNSTKRIKIPQVCQAMGVPYLNMIEMFRALGETF